MKNILKLEEFSLFVLGCLGFFYFGGTFPEFLLLSLLPDLGMLGYVLGPVVGATTYNLFHHKAVAALVFVLGYLLSMRLLVLVGVMMFTHSSIDRVLGFGLKLRSGFKHTHLGNLR